MATKVESHCFRVGRPKYFFNRSARAKYFSNQVASAIFIYFNRSALAFFYSIRALVRASAPLAARSRREGIVRHECFEVSHAQSRGHRGVGGAGCPHHGQAGVARPSGRQVGEAGGTGGGSHCLDMDHVGAGALRLRASERAIASDG
jgi:hypothetical protein